MLARLAILAALAFAAGFAVFTIAPEEIVGIGAEGREVEILPFGKSRLERGPVVAERLGEGGEVFGRKIAERVWS
jgi:hypothetical protein